MSGTCKHKKMYDHVVGKRQVGNEMRKVWKCSHCGNEDIWGPTWSYFGNIECKYCWTALMDSVNCGCTDNNELKDQP